jgi:hypothetical protein
MIASSPSDCAPIVPRLCPNWLQLAVFPLGY